jgi:hypothetical protein
VNTLTARATLGRLGRDGERFGETPSVGPYLVCDGDDLGPEPLGVLDSHTRPVGENDKPLGRPHAEPVLDEEEVDGELEKAVLATSAAATVSVTVSFGS